MDDPAPLGVGERVLLIDGKDRRYLLKLREGATFHTHSGLVGHDLLIGAAEGATIEASTGRRFLVFRPTLADVVLKMPRGAQVIYPKDLGAILVSADIGPGMRVLESGVGSGALSMTLLRAGASVLGYELREEFAAKATENVTAMLGEGADYTIEIRDVTHGIEATGLDRVLLDMPCPWDVVEHAATALRPGGILLAYLPTINQTALLREALSHGPWGLAESAELLRRSWHVEKRSVRPTIGWSRTRGSSRRHAGCRHGSGSTCATTCAPTCARIGWTAGSRRTTSPRRGRRPSRAR